MDKKTQMGNWSRRQHTIALLMQWPSLLLAMPDSRVDADEVRLFQNALEVRSAAIQNGIPDKLQLE